MAFSDRLTQLRIQRGLSQEELADLLGVSRQTIGKWEKGLASPELSGLIALSSCFAVSIDALVKEGSCAAAAPVPADEDALAAFLLRAKRSTYAAHAPECAPCRPGSHDLSYTEETYTYLDSYFGGTSFHGQEAVWAGACAVWCMNYSGRTLDDRFSGDFLKLALQHGALDAPYRGPAFFQRDGYTYLCRSHGSLTWFSGDEAIFFGDRLVYECRFHGGAVR